MKISNVEIKALLEAQHLQPMQRTRCTNSRGWCVEEWLPIPIGWRAATSPYETFQEAVEEMERMPNIYGVQLRVYEALTDKPPQE